MKKYVYIFKKYLENDVTFLLESMIYLCFLKNIFHYNGTFSKLRNCLYAGDFMIFLMTFRTLKYPATYFLWPQPPLTKYKEPYNSNSVFFFLQKKYTYIYECIYICTYISKGIKLSF